MSEIDERVERERVAKMLLAAAITQWLDVLADEMVAAGDRYGAALDDKTKSGAERIEYLHRMENAVQIHGAIVEYTGDEMRSDIADANTYFWRMIEKILKIYNEGK